MRCDHCEYRGSWDCDDHRLRDSVLCASFKLDFSTLSERQKREIQWRLMDRSDIRDKEDETVSLTSDDRKMALIWLSSLLKNSDYMILVPKTVLKLLYSALSGQPEIVRCECCADGTKSE